MYYYNIYKKTFDFYKFAEIFKFSILRCMVSTLPEYYIFAFVRNALVDEIWTRKDQPTS